MANINPTVRTPDGKQIAAPASGVAQRTTTALAIGASWDTGIVYYTGNRNIQISFASDQNGSFKVEYFDSNGTLLPFMGNTTAYNAADGVFQAGIAAKGDAVKITYTNNGTAQTSFFFELALLNTPIQETLRSVSTPMSATNLASTTHAVVEGREAATGSYKQATVSQVGDKVALDVNVINRSNETQKVEVTNPTAVTFPTTQQVSGSVSVSNLPATQPISAASLPLPAGAATSAKQDTGNASLASIDSKLTNPIPVSFAGTLATADWVRTNIMAGKGFIWSSGVMSVTVALSNMKVMIKNPVGSGKTLHVYSIVVDNGATVEAYGAVRVNPTTNLPTTSKGTGSNLYAGHPNTNGGIEVFADAAGTAMGGGTLVSSAFLPPDQENELLKNGTIYIIPAGVSVGINIPYLSLLNSVNNQIVLYGIVM